MHFLEKYETNINQMMGKSNELKVMHPLWYVQS